MSSEIRDTCSGQVAVFCSWQLHPVIGGRSVVYALSFFFGFLPKLERTGFVQSKGACMFTPPSAHPSFLRVQPVYVLRSQVTPHSSRLFVRSGAHIRCRLGIPMKSAVEPDARQSRIIPVTLLTKRWQRVQLLQDMSQVAPSRGGPPARLHGHPLSQGLLKATGNFNPSCSCCGVIQA